MKRLFGFASVLCLALACGCGVQIDPIACTGATVEAGNFGSAATQYVSFVLELEDEFELADAMDYLEVTIDGAELDSAAVSTEFTKQGSTTMNLVLSPAAGAEDSFSLGAGQVVLAGDFLTEPVACMLPSGVAIEQLDATDSSVTFSVLASATVNCSTWIEISEELPSVCVANDEFETDTCETVAERIAKTINSSYSGYFSAEADGSQVCVTVLGYEVSPHAFVVEGVNAALN